MKKILLISSFLVMFLYSKPVVHAQIFGPSKKSMGTPTQPGSTSGSIFSRITGKSKQKYSSEEMQLQTFWTEYYKSLANYYASLDNVDWVAYYKQNGYPIDPRFYNPYGMTPGMTVVPMQYASPAFIPSNVPGMSSGSQIQRVSASCPTCQQKNRCPNCKPGKLCPNCQQIPNCPNCQGKPNSSTSRNGEILPIRWQNQPQR